MRHSIIIPNRNYNAYLRHCLWSIHRSARICGREDYEILVVDQGSLEAPAPTPDMRATVISQAPEKPTPDGKRYFNKPRAQNEGIRQATGEILSFLDADAIVGERWMDCVDSLRRLGPRALTKLCYRVRYLPGICLEAVDEASPARRDEIVDGQEGWFSRYDTYQRAIECYGEVDKDPHNNPSGRKWDGNGIPEEPVFGNSQFSIPRTELGELRFDEKYVGRGFEDLSMNRAIFREKGAAYRAGIVTDPKHALLHIRNQSQGELWGAGRQNSANFKRFHST